jgi:predicted HicB family RNase H-like nuclease
MVKTGRAAIRLDGDLKAKAEAYAKADRRSLSAWVEALIAREIERLEARSKGKVKK